MVSASQNRKKKKMERANQSRLTCHVENVASQDVPDARESECGKGRQATAAAEDAHLAPKLRQGRVGVKRRVCRVVGPGVSRDEEPQQLVEVEAISCVWKAVAEDFQVFAVFVQRVGLWEGRGVVGS